MRAVRPDVIVNAAARTAVDKAGSEPDLASALNALAPAVLALEAAALAALLVRNQGQVLPLASPTVMPVDTRTLAGEPIAT